MRNLHDNYSLANSVSTVFNHDTDRVKMLSKNGPFTSQSFLSCSVISIGDLTPKSYVSVSVQDRQVSEIARKTPLHYSATATRELSRYPRESIGDGLSGPLETVKEDLILGIDPGVSGAIAVIKNGLTPKFIGVYDMPTYKLKVADKMRNRIDLTALSFLLESYSNQTKIALIEDVSSMPSDGHVGAFTFGFATGVIHGALAMAGIKIAKVKPSVWKASFGLGSEKELSVALAIKFYPESAKHLKLKKDHGKAEAILLAHFAIKNMRKA